MDIQIIRTLDNGTETTGKLYITGETHFACDTLERTYADNQHGISAIPGGKYHCIKVGASEAIPYPHISLTNVSNRSGICIHAGNLYTHSKGCILLGKGYGDLNKDGQQDILNSRNTFENFLKIVPDEFSLSITEAQIKTKKP